MMRTLLLAAIRAFVVACRGQPIMRPAHVAPRRRGFSLWHRHGGSLLYPRRAVSARGNSTTAPLTESSGLAHCHARTI